jgi:glucuronosyltransferase
MTKTLCFALIFLSAACSISGLKVLGVVPFGSTSHFKIGHSIVKTLANAGHDVTVISPYPQHNKIKNYRDVDCSSVLEKFKKG